MTAFSILLCVMLGSSLTTREKVLVLHTHTFFVFIFLHFGRCRSIVPRGMTPLSLWPTVVDLPLVTPLTLGTSDTDECTLLRERINTCRPLSLPPDFCVNIRLMPHSLDILKVALSTSQHEQPDDAVS